MAGFPLRSKIVKMTSMFAQPDPHHDTQHCASSARETIIDSQKAPRHRRPNKSRRHRRAKRTPEPVPRWIIEDDGTDIPEQGEDAIYKPEVHAIHDQLFGVGSWIKSPKEDDNAGVARRSVFVTDDLQGLRACQEVSQSSSRLSKHTRYVASQLGLVSGQNTTISRCTNHREQRAAFEERVFEAARLARGREISFLDRWHLVKAARLRNGRYLERVLAKAVHQKAELHRLNLKARKMIERQQSVQSKPRKLKMELPMIMYGSTVIATADTGSDDNIIANEVVNELGLTIDDALEHRKEFRMGNSRVVKALGRVRTHCTFARDQDVQISCWFWVFETLITPLIMGMAFLSQTETMTRNRHRLQPRHRLSGSPFLCALLNNPKQRLPCFISLPFKGRARLNENFPKDSAVIVQASADTGSEIDLISAYYCRRFSLPILPVNLEQPYVQFADGSTATLSGRVELKVAAKKYPSESASRTFYILKDLTSDVVLGEDLLDELDAFESCEEYFSGFQGTNMSEVNTIVWLKRHERFWLGRDRTMSLDPPEPTPANSTTTPRTDSSLSSTLRRLVLPSSTRQANVPSSQSPDPSSSLDAQIDLSDAQENRRREQFVDFVARLPVEKQAAAWAKEANQRAEFDFIRSRQVSSSGQIRF